MDNNINQNKKLSPLWESCGCNTRLGSVMWGVFFLLFGLNILGQELGYITFPIPVWTIALVAFGLYLIARGVTK